jgi:hypothetical protein
MRITLALAVLVLLTAAPPASAQLGDDAPTPEQIAQARVLMRRTMNPAALAAEHHEELGLTDSQLARLDSLAAPLDSAINRVVDEMGPYPSAAARDSAERRGVELHDELTRIVIEVERGLNAVLTPAQRSALNDIRAQTMFEMMTDAMGIDGKSGGKSKREGKGGP